jgi:type I restriction enzyme, S subunit
MKNLTNNIGFGSTELIVARPIKGAMHAQYLRWLFISTPFMKLGKAHMYGAGGQKRVPDEFVLNFQIGIPPIDEQNTIINYLNNATTKIDALAKETQNAIILLQERRKALISAAVTGKIDVRKLNEKE